MNISGETIRAARERAHLTQQELGEQVGVSLRTIGNWERGESVPRSRMGAIIEVLDLDEDGEGPIGMSFPQNGLQNLILDRKGTRTYERLSRDCGGLPTTKNLQKLVSREVRAFPDKQTIEGLARGLGVTVTAVVLAGCRSLGLRVSREDEDVLELPGAGSLPPQARDLLVGMSRELQNAYAQPWRDRDDYHLAAHEGHPDVDPGETEPTP